MALFQLFLYNHVGQNGIGTSIGKELLGTSHKGMGDAVESPPFISLLDLGFWSRICGGWCCKGTQRYAGWMHGAQRPAASCTARSDLFLFLAAMLIVCGALVNGPYALITTAVSADLVRGTSQTPQKLLPLSQRDVGWDFCIPASLCKAKRSGGGQGCHTSHSAPCLP